MSTSSDQLESGNHLCLRCRWRNPWQARCNTLVVENCRQNHGERTGWTREDGVVKSCARIPVNAKTDPEDHAGKIRLSISKDTATSVGSRNKARKASKRTKSPVRRRFLPPVSPLLRSSVLHPQPPALSLFANIVLVAEVCCTSMASSVGTMDAGVFTQMAGSACGQHLNLDWGIGVYVYLATSCP